MTRILIDYGDLTRQHVDAIVNAANSALLGGGGVDGAIHQAAGPELREECAKLGGCPPGQVRLTSGHRLAARWILHTVGPLWSGGENGEAEVLASCYRNCLDVAAQNGIKTLAFPSIATGAFAYPIEQACRIALKELAAGLDRHPDIESATVVCYDRDTLEAYLAAHAESQRI